MKQTQEKHSLCCWEHGRTAFQGSWGEKVLWLCWCLQQERIKFPFVLRKAIHTTIPHFVPQFNIPSCETERKKNCSSFLLNPRRGRNIQQRFPLTAFRLADNHFPDGDDDPSFAKYSCFESWWMLAAERQSRGGKLKCLPSLVSRMKRFWKMVWMSVGEQHCYFKTCEDEMPEECLFGCIYF